MRAKNVIISTISIVIIFLMIASFVPLSYLMRPTGYNNDIISGFYAESDNTLDMVYIGGSACFVYWEPLRAWNRYGFTSYNFAHDTVTPEAIKYYIKEVSKTQTPKLWLIDLRPFQYGEEPYSDTVSVPNMYYEVAIRNGTDHMLYSQNRNDLINSSVKDKQERISYYFDFIKYHSNWGYVGRDLIECVRQKSLAPFDSADNAKRNPLKGFYFIEKTLPVSFTDCSYITEEKELPAEVNDVFLDLIDYCTNENLTVLFVVHSYCQTEEHKMEYNYMKRIIEENGLDFLNANDYCQDIALDYSLDMYNDNHVNVFGAEKYTDFLAEYIAARYELPDKRGQAEYEEWDRLYNDFESATAEVKQIILSRRNQDTENKDDEQ